MAGKSRLTILIQTRSSGIYMRNLCCQQLQFTFCSSFRSMFPLVISECGGKFIVALPALENFADELRTETEMCLFFLVYIPSPLIFIAVKHAKAFKASRNSLVGKFRPAVFSVNVTSDKVSRKIGKYCEAHKTNSLKFVIFSHFRTLLMSLCNV